MEDNQKFELTEALAKWVLAESKKVNFIVEHMDDSSVFSKEELLLTNKQVTQLVHELVK